MTSLSDAEITKKTKVPIWSSLRTTVPLAFLIPLITCVGMLGTIAISSGYRTAEKFKKQSMEALNAQIQERLVNYLEKPHLINEINAEAIREKQLNLQKINTLERYFWKQSKIFQNVNGIQFGTEKEGLVRSIVREENNLTYNVGFLSGQRENVVFETLKNGKRGKRIKAEKDYDPRKRTWYKAAVQAGKPTWTKIFAKRTSAETQLRLSAVQPVYDKNNNRLLGVLAVDFFLTQISDFLRKLSQNTSREIFIVDRSGELIAASSDKDLFIDKGKKQGIERVVASNSEDGLIKAAAQKVSKEWQGFSNLNQQMLFKFTSKDGEQQIAEIKPFNDKYGLDWLVVLVVPEKEFTQAVDQTTNTTIILGIGTFAFSALLGLLVTNWLVKPILLLNNAAKQIEDDSIPFEPEKIESITQRSDEIGEFAGMFKEMALQIFAREKSLKDRVQQMRQETDQAKKAALASGLSGNVDVNTLLLRSQKARQKVGD